MQSLLDKLKGPPTKDVHGFSTMSKQPKMADEDIVADVDKDRLLEVQRMQIRLLKDEIAGLMKLI